ncbi:MAG: alpha/beta hydrolase [Burkholderiales bacterium]|nr:alpha/beta hydrolase [Burkholderiales bacterium]
MKPARGWAASLSLACCTGMADAEPQRPSASPVAAAAPAGQRAAPAHLGPDDRLGDLLDHPALAGFARLLLPHSDAEVDRTTRLGDFGSLLPYHKHVDARDVVAGLNRLIDDAADGRRVFIDIYTPSEKTRDPTKADTGLFLLRGRPGAPFAVIAPGGGFSYVATVHEGLPYALAINRHGFNAFVLRYRVGQGSGAAIEDLAAALSTLFRHAAALQVSTDAYSLWGSSAGARMAASIGSHGVARFGADPLPRPAAVVMAYTGHSDTSSDEPPTFVVVGEYDRIAPPTVMERRLQALERAGVMVAYRKVPGLGHGFGPGTGTAAQGWIDDAVRFWERAACRGASRAPR